MLRNTIKTMDDLLYDIGLCLTPSSDEPNKRHFFRTPFVIFSLSLMFITWEFIWWQIGGILVTRMS